MRTESTRVISIKAEKRIKSIKKLHNGDLQIEQYSGAVFTISASDPLFQQFAIYTVLADL